MNAERDNFDGERKYVGDIMAEFKPDKFKELILYIAGKCTDDPTFGATKLNKILYFADFYMYGESGTPITGADYVKLRQGPAPRQLLTIREELTQAGDACISKAKYHGYPQDRLIPTREPNLDLFNAKEIALVDDIIQKLWGINAADISDYTHRLAGWRIAQDDSAIPYESVFLSDEGLTVDDAERGKELVEHFGWMD
jgi:hypothetical protein